MPLERVELAKHREEEKHSAPNMATAKKPVGKEANRPKSSSSTNVKLIFVAVLVVAISGGLYFAPWSGSASSNLLTFPGETPGPLPQDQAHVPSTDAKSLEYYNIISDVPRVAWNPDRPFAQWAIEQDKPVILTNSAVHRWPALKKWTPQFLAANSRNLPLEFKTGGDPVFIYSQRKPLNRVSGFEFSRPFNLTHINLETFWNRVSGQQDDIAPHERYLYFTGCLTRSQDEVRNAYASPTQLFQH